MNNLILLAIETSSTICSVAVLKGGECIKLRESNSPMQHAEILPFYVREVIKSSGLKIDMIDAVAVSFGPGSFTGLRIGLSFAKGLALAHDLPILPIPTMQSLAYGLNKRKPSNGLFFSHGNNLFYQKYIWNDNIPNFDKKPILEEGNKILKKINTKGNTFHWNCSRYVKDIKNIIPISPSAKLVGLLGGLLFDQILEEKPYQLEPEYIAPFKVGTHK